MMTFSPRVKNVIKAQRKLLGPGNWTFGINDQTLIFKEKSGDHVEVLFREEVETVIDGTDIVIRFKNEDPEILHPHKERNFLRTVQTSS